MLKAQILSWINQAIRFKLHPDQIILIMDAAQRMAFDHNCHAFLVWTESFTPYALLSFTSGYTNAVTADVGKTVVGGTSGATGLLVSYDNDAETWVVDLTDDAIPFEDGEAVTITTGTGAGTLGATDGEGVSGYLGPYAAPTDPPCRKIWGITTETDGRFFGTDESLRTPMDDFDFVGRTFNPKNVFKPGREDNLNKTFTFAQAPTIGVTYRWVYWRDAPTISTSDDMADETKILIPAAFHMNYVNACIKLAQISLFGEDVDPETIRAFFGPWWDTLFRAYTPMGKGSNGTLNPRGRASSII